MSIEKMELVNIAGLIRDLDGVLYRCCKSECFHLETAGLGSEDGLVALTEDNPYIDPLKRLISLSAQLSYRPKHSEYDIYGSTSTETADDLDDYVTSLEEKAKALTEKIRALSEKISLRQQAGKQLVHLKGLSVDFRNIFSCTHIYARVGKLPIESFTKLQYYEEKPFVFVSYDKDKEYYWGLYFVPVEHRQVVDDIFRSLFYERVIIPDFIKGDTETAIEDNEKEIQLQQEELERTKHEVDALISERKDELDRVFSKLLYMHKTFELRAKASIINDKFYLVGFVPSVQAHDFLKLFADQAEVSVLANPPELDKRLTPPTKLKNNRFANPFSMFVEMYGLPSYHGFNPTTLVAITYTLIFGIMFGDLGQGAVILIAGIVMWAVKKNAISGILIRIGASSALFGLVYGSVFGYEELLNPLYKMIGLSEKPLEVFQSTNTILIGAIAIGVVLIICSICINIFIGFKEKDYERAIFGNNGLAGLVFYSSALVGVVGTVVLKMHILTPLYVALLLILPLLLMFFRIPLSKIMHTSKKPEESEGGIGNFIAGNFFELFEYILSYITNTMSFLRIGGFVLSHAGMMLVVMTLADGVSQGISPVIVVFGNIFVMAMEGMIVAIQVIRLEFYEIFSRFYEGDGHAFQPVKVDYNEEIN